VSLRDSAFSSATTFSSNTADTGAALTGGTAMGTGRDNDEERMAIAAVFFTIAPSIDPFAVRVLSGLSSRSIVILLPRFRAPEQLL
jgi:acid phosphatase family membrane protein YuiD